MESHHVAALLLRLMDEDRLSPTAPGFRDSPTANLSPYSRLKEDTARELEVVDELGPAGAPLAGCPEVNLAASSASLFHRNMMPE